MRLRFSHASRSQSKVLGDTSQAESALSTESVKMTCTGRDSSSKEVCQLAAKADPKAKKRIAWGQNLQANS